MRGERLGRVAVALTLAASLAACEQGPASDSTDPSAYVATSTNARPAMTGINFKCSLPVMEPIQGTGQLRYRALLVRFPAGGSTVDPGGDFDQEGDFFISTARPTLRGTDSPFWYDRPASRWVPARPDVISPDGSHYAYMTAGPDAPATNLHPVAHIVTVATGVEQTISLPALPPYLGWGVAAYRADGIYLFHVPYEGETQPGLWLLDPTTGRVVQVPDDGIAVTRDDDQWIADVDPSDPHVVVSSYDGSELPNRITRKDQRTGRNVTWLYRPGKVVRWLGTDKQGQPFVVVSSGMSSEDQFELLLLRAPESVARLSTGSDLLELTGPVKDRYATWFSGAGHIYLYSPEAGFRIVPSVTGTLAGSCG